MAVLLPYELVHIWRRSCILQKEEIIRQAHSVGGGRGLVEQYSVLRLSTGSKDNAIQAEDTESIALHTAFTIKYPHIYMSAVYIYYAVCRVLCAACCVQTYIPGTSYSKYAFLCV